MSEERIIIEEVDNERALRELPADIRRRAVEYLRGAFSADDKRQILETHRERGANWWMWIVTLRLPGPGNRVIPRGHFTFGMRVRNALRTGLGIGDAALPRGNWDDYYVPLVEIAVGIRPDPDSQRSSDAATTDPADT